MMKTQYAQQCAAHPACELRVGTSSWDDTVTSIKFTWFDKQGKACRGGEFPSDALPQIVTFALRTSVTEGKAIAEALAAGL